MSIFVEILTGESGILEEVRSTGLKVFEVIWEIRIVRAVIGIRVVVDNDRIYTCGLIDRGEYIEVGFQWGNALICNCRGSCINVL